MPLFAYRATDDDGKEVKGSLDAPTEAGARQTLSSDLHLTVLELWEASRSHVSPEQSSAAPPLLRTSFVFEGKDAAGTVHKGTIQADSKYEAFEKLRQEHRLRLTLLSPMGVKAPVFDPDLAQWQPTVEKVIPAVAPVQTPINPQSIKVPSAPAAAPVTSNQSQSSAPKKTIGFTILPDSPLAPAMQSIPSSLAPRSPKGEVGSHPLKKYLPLLSTLRLYAGWLLAWYALFVALGYYSTVRSLPFEIPLVMSFYASPLIYSVTLAVFLFLACSALHKAIQGKMISGLVLTISGVVAFFVLLSLIHI